LASIIYNAAQLISLHCIGSKGLGTCSHEINTAGAQLFELNLLDELLGLYGEPDLSISMLLHLTRAVFNLCTNYYSTFQTCTPDTVNETSDNHNHNNHNQNQKNKQKDGQNSDTTENLDENEDGTVQQTCMNTKLLRTKMMSSISIKIKNSKENENIVCNLIDVLSWLARHVHLAQKKNSCTTTATTAAATTTVTLERKEEERKKYCHILII